MSDNRGFSLIPTLIISSLLLSSAVYATFRAWQAVRDGKDLVSLLRARERALSGVMRASSTSFPSEDSMVCHRAVGASSPQVIERFICALTLSSHDTQSLPAVLDGRWGKRSIFSLIVPPERTELASGCTPHSLRHTLSPSSVRSDATCVVTLQNVNRSTFFPHNISTEDPVYLFGDNETVLYTRGAASLAHIMIRGSVMIMSLGDIHIDTLSLAPASAITLISVTGVVSITHYSGGPSITIWGKEGVSLPSEHQPSGGAISPRLRRVLPIFIQ